MFRQANKDLLRIYRFTKTDYNSTPKYFDVKYKNTKKLTQKIINYRSELSKTIGYLNDIVERKYNLYSRHDEVYSFLKGLLEMPRDIMIDSNTETKNNTLRGKLDELSNKKYIKSKKISKDRWVFEKLQTVRTSLLNILFD